jgi:hypothetical protein
VSKTIEIRLQITEEELEELRSGMDRKVIELAEEIEEDLEMKSPDIDEKISRLEAAQNARCKLYMNKSVPVQRAR